MALLCIAALAVIPAAASAEGEQVHMAKEAGLGSGSAIASLIYGPIKLVYAVGGLVVGSLAYLFSGGDSDVAEIVFTPSLRGDYVVTPDHLTGRRSLEFFGRKPGYRPPEADVATAQDEWSEGW